MCFIQHSTTKCQFDCSARVCVIVGTFLQWTQPKRCNISSNTTYGHHTLALSGRRCPRFETSSMPAAHASHDHLYHKMLTQIGFVACTVLWVEIQRTMMTAAIWYVGDGSQLSTLTSTWLWSQLFRWECISQKRSSVPVAHCSTHTSIRARWQSTFFSPAEIEKTGRRCSLREGAVCSSWVYVSCCSTTRTEPHLVETIFPFVLAQYQRFWYQGTNHEPSTVPRALRASSNALLSAGGAKVTRGTKTSARVLRRLRNLQLTALLELVESKTLTKHPWQSWYHSW